MAFTTGYYHNAQGKLVYGKYNTSPGYYNSAGKWVTSGSSNHGDHNHHGGNGGGTPPPPPTPTDTPNPVPTPTPGNTPDGNIGLGYADGGPQVINGGYPTSTNPAAFQRQMSLNLENSSNNPQGSQTPWAQPSSVSALITGLLRQSQNAPADYWETWAQDKTGVTLQGTASSQFGIQLAQSQPMGAFGTSTVMNPNQQQQQQTQNATGATPTPIPDPYNSGAPIVPTDIFPATDQVYNPWSRGQGGEYNQYGPSSAQTTQSSMEALTLANAYFAPQRLELAYQLGSMETDMRRLSANLGRQGDDPILQAKLYKEGMQAVRTLDVQQNTFAFQMVEQRRKEENQNYQYYDQLAQQEYQLGLANRQFYDRLELDRRYYNLSNWNVMNAPTSTTSSNTTTSTTPAPAAQSQVDYGLLNVNAPNNSFVNNSIYNPNNIYSGGGNLLK